jgi:NhaP-type Na+/H+ or K+/H+ antiporter
LVTVLRTESLVNDGTALVIYGLAVAIPSAAVEPGSRVLRRRCERVRCDGS